ncbi:MAG: beta-ketoacyl-ACP synthase [Burkholderiales bacterium]|nr:beta-ketoacyl-ACP synthase [Burkholderiales bacterium]
MTAAAFTPPAAPDHGAKARLPAPRAIPRAITHYTLASAIGLGRAATRAAMHAQRSGLVPCDFLDVALPGYIGAVAGVDAVQLPAALAHHDCRNNRLAWLGLQQDGFADAVLAARRRWGASRVAVVLGTSTSGILQTELAYRHRHADGSLPADFHYATTHNTYSTAGFVSAALGLEGPCWVVSTACSSSAKVFGAAARLIDACWADAVVVGGVDSLCLTTLYGFNSLELFSHQICQPWDAARSGLSLGEAAAYALLEREPAPGQPVAGWLLGCGESNDGYHMSSPHPDGAGARAAMRQALARAGLAPGDIDYINLHGTATPNNDAAEDKAVCAEFGSDLASHTPCSSTKGATGHTLGAAGAVEAAICLICLEDGLAPAGLNRSQPDPELHAAYLDANRQAPLRHVLSNSFGFGGSNASLVFGRESVRVAEPGTGAAAVAPVSSVSAVRVTAGLTNMAAAAVTSAASLADGAALVGAAWPSIEVEVLGIGLLGPGLVNWSAAQPALRGEAPWVFAPAVLPAPARLPAAERRRASAAVKVAMAVADAACADAGLDPGNLASVFTSSSGDGLNCHVLCEQLADPSRLVSPTRFTNSVHNAAAGYWHIAVASQAASTSVCAFDASFTAGLIEAAIQLLDLGQPLLLVASDTPYPEPLHGKRALPDSLGLALLLAPAGFTAAQATPAAALATTQAVTQPIASSDTRPVTRLRISLCPASDAGPATPCADAGLEALRLAIPAARGLPLLAALAGPHDAAPRRLVLGDDRALRLVIELS